MEQIRIIEQYAQTYQNIYPLLVVFMALAAKRRSFKLSTKEEALKNQEYKCLFCGMKVCMRNSEAHHCIPDSLGGPITLQNCAVLCHRCHKIADDLAIGHGIRIISQDPDLYLRLKSLIRQLEDHNNALNNSHPDLKAMFDQIKIAFGKIDPNNQNLTFDDLEIIINALSSIN
ncbi:MAG: hypothetical protein KatS3mg091_523 [Patescibacteria group bacterium]|nr:MAG: hypothetical protein KatS3mg091_523 [Patescibacteria group bacterium]